MRTIFLILAISSLPISLYAQDMGAIQLKQEQVSFSPKSFYISDVTDSIGDTSSIGWITNDGKKQPVTMQDGVTTSFKNYIGHNITQDKSTQAVVLNVAKMDIEIKKKGTTWVVSASMGISFYAGNMKLVEYNGSGHGEMDSDPREYAAQFISQAIQQDMSKFDSWWATHKNNIPVSSVVKVNVAIGKTISKPDCIIYSTGRPLQISDFTGPVQNDVGELAATYSGMAFSTTGETENGQLVINATIAPYFDKTQSWFKEAGKNPILLAHEQAHFDITAIKACELAIALRNTSFTKENYLALFEQLQKKYNDEANDEQNTYDNETNHGTIPDKQQQWQQKITQQVRAIGCY